MPSEEVVVHKGARHTILDTILVGGLLGCIAMLVYRLHQMEGMVREVKEEWDAQKRTAHRTNGIFRRPMMGDGTEEEEDDPPQEPSPDPVESEHASEEEGLRVEDNVPTPPPTHEDALHTIHEEGEEDDEAPPP